MKNLEERKEIVKNEIELILKDCAILNTELPLMLEKVMSVNTDEEVKMFDIEMAQICEKLTVIEL